MDTIFNRNVFIQFIQAWDATPHVLKIFRAQSAQQDYI